MPQKNRSLRALDALNFCNAGIQTGLGPFIAIFYAADRHWNPGQIGLLLGIQSVAGVLSQTFVGHAIDETPHKRPVAALAAITVTLGCLGIALLRNFALQALVQAVIGVAITVFPAVTSAFALGMVDTREASGRIARNEAYTHSGNVAFAIIAGVVGVLVRVRDIFFAAGVFAFGMAVSALAVRREDVNYEAARSGEQKGSGQNEGENKEGEGLAAPDGATCYMIGEFASSPWQWCFSMWPTHPPFRS